MSVSFDLKVNSNVLRAPTITTPILEDHDEYWEDDKQDMLTHQLALAKYGQFQFQLMSKGLALAFLTEFSERLEKGITIQDIVSSFTNNTISMGDGFNGTFKNQLYCVESEAFLNSMNDLLDLAYIYFMAELKYYFVLNKYKNCGSAEGDIIMWRYWMLNRVNMTALARISIRYHSEIRNRGNVFDPIDIIRVKTSDGLQTCSWEHLYSGMVHKKDRDTPYTEIMSIKLLGMWITYKNLQTSICCLLSNLVRITISKTISASNYKDIEMCASKIIFTRTIQPTILRILNESGHTVDINQPVECKLCVGGETTNEWVHELVNRVLSERVTLVKHTHLSTLIDNMNVKVEAIKLRLKNAKRMTKSLLQSEILSINEYNKNRRLLWILLTIILSAFLNGVFTALKY